jgi:hypothetical protein
MSLESCLQLTAKILVEWVIFVDVTLAICMHWPCCVQHACNIGWRQLLAPFVYCGHFPHFLCLSESRKLSLSHKKMVAFSLFSWNLSQVISKIAFDRGESHKKQSNLNFFGLFHYSFNGTIFLECKFDYFYRAWTDLAGGASHKSFPKLHLTVVKSQEIVKLNFFVCFTILLME